MKRKILILSIVAICFAICAVGTLSYYNAADTAHNVITTGNIDIEIEEKMETENGLVDFPEEGLAGVMPGEEASKIVKVKNTGTGEAWIRAKVTPQINLPGENGDALPIEDENGKLLVEILLSDSWKKIGDYYYCTEPVKSGEYTPVFFDRVKFSAAMDNLYQNCIVNVLVEAEAVQTANNPLPASGDYSEIPGWPQP